MSDTKYSHGKLLLSIVNRGQGERLVSVTKHAGARGGTILLARSTSTSTILSLLGIGDSDKDVVITLVHDDLVQPVITALGSFNCLKKHRGGICMQLDVRYLLRHLAPGETAGPPIETTYQRSETMGSPHTLITFIVNKGYADDAMIAARRAGATGGTILNARGTGKEEDIRFFGVQLVPEKEMLMVLVGSGQTGAVLEAVRKIPCLAEPGAGIAFCIDVERFMTFGAESS
jgi:nitrogen regulatory protein PII